MRAAVINGINSGKSSRQIAKGLFLSLQTINSARKAMKEYGYKSYRERAKTERKKKVYSYDPFTKRKKYRGRPQRTKYGTIYMPY